jgi:phosphomannomutase
MHRILPGVAEIHGEYNPSFGEVDHPEPIAECLEPLMTAVKKGKYAMGLATDGDADRLGAVDHTGAFVDSHRIFVLLMKYLYEDKKRKGGVAKTVSLTSMVNAYCEKKGITLYETPVGMKHIAKLMQETPIVIGGEESGGLATSLHIPERDGIFNGLLLLELMAAKKKSLKQLCDELDQEFGPHRYRRRDVHMTEERKRKILAVCAKGPKKIGKYAVQETNTKDGFKFYIDGGWLLIRASGTEPLLRFYAEAKTLTMVNELIDAALDL